MAHAVPAPVSPAVGLTTEASLTVEHDPTRAWRMASYSWPCSTRWRRPRRIRKIVKKKVLKRKCARTVAPAAEAPLSNDPT